jgi:DNA-binding transcriptional LysR family regulator
MDVRTQRYVLAVVELGSDKRASKLLSIAQSAVSHQVSMLEKEPDKPLLVRSRRRASRSLHSSRRRWFSSASAAACRRGAHLSAFAT